MFKKFVSDLHNAVMYFAVALLFAILIRYMVNMGEYVGLDDITSMRTQIAEMQISIQTVEKNMDELGLRYRESLLDNVGIDDRIQDLTKEINAYKLLAGYEDVYGEGVIVIIDDADRSILAEENPANLIVHDLDIRFLVNELQNAGAEAISINGERLVQGVTRITCVGPTISINGVKQAQPYVIKAIGDRFELHNALNTYESVATRLKQGGLKLFVETQKYIKINRYR